MTATDHSPQTIRVVKVGGSLFQFEGLVWTLRKWLAAQPAATNILLAGGGALADAIRDADARFVLTEEASHWLCVEALRVTARLLTALLPEVPLVTTLAELRLQLASRPPPATVVFCPADFLQRDEQQLLGTPLPHAWSVTSDSIAARLAQAVAAGELVLLKSAAPPPDLGAAAADYVDEWFATAARDVPSVRIVNLREQ
jgi:aspartokinase-like uncharacterized kinase